MKKLLSALLIALLLPTMMLMSACNDASKTSDDKLSFDYTTNFQYYYSNLNGINFPVTKSEKGYYVFLPNNYLYYIDRKSQAATPLCNKPNCSHNSVDCNAYFNLFVNASGESANVVQYYDGNLYIVVKDEDAMGNFLGNILYKVTPDGSTREKLIEFKDGISHWLIHKGYFYFSQDKFADDIDSSSVYDSFSIKRYKINNIKSKPEEIFNSKNYSDNLRGTFQFTAYDDYIYVPVLPISEDEIKKQEESGKVTVSTYQEFYSININTIKINQIRNDEGDVCSPFFYNGQLTYLIDNSDTNGKFKYFTSELDGSNPKLLTEMNYGDNLFANESQLYLQNFSANTDGYQQVSLSVTPEKTNEVVNYIAFAFVYGYNENEMTVDNAEVNISPLIQSSEDSKNETSEKEAVDEEVLSESIDKSKPYMQTSSEYDSTGNYVTSETNEQGSTTKYAYDTNGNKTAVTDGNGNVTNYTYDANGNVLSIKNGTSGNDYSYTGSGSVSKITHNGFSYSFNYDVFYNLLSTKIGNVAITSNTYNSNGNLAKTTYANGDYFEYTYDDYGNISLITGETGKIAEMIYNKQGLVTKAVDYSSGETSYYYYTFDGSLESEYRTSSDGSLTHYIITDSNGNTIEKTSVNGQTKTITTGTDKDGKSFVSNDGVTNETSTDDFGRTTQVRTVRSDGTLVFNTDYEYADGKAENSTTNLVSKYSQSYGSDSVLSYDYSYDNNGNITEIKQNGKLINKYTYDSLNELKEEYDYVNKFYINYSYDGAGNLQNKYEQVLDPTYGYPTGTQHGNTYEYTDTSWKDKLTKINGDNITYDANGNPLTYRDGMSFEWENGRILKKINTSDKSVQMSYDSNGMRTQKTVDGVKTNYYYDSNKNLIALVKGNDTLLFYYDSDGSATSFSYNGTMYFYVKNLQGDVIRIIDLAGTEVASYVYDAWGNIKDTKGDLTVRELNPIRYRGYVYDTETSLYYLQSRYYDPFAGRFLNADIFYDTNTETPLSTNMFAYGENNPANSIDPYGTLTITIRRWMIAGPIDALLMAIPGIGAVFAPVKAIAKSTGKKLLKSKLKTPITKFIKFIAKSAKKMMSLLKNVIRKIPHFGKKILSKIKLKKFENMIAGATNSAIVNKFLNFIIEDVDIVLSVGGAISGILDYIFDKSINNVIWEFKLW